MGTKEQADAKCEEDSTAAARKETERSRIESGRGAAGGAGAVQK